MKAQYIRAAGPHIYHVEKTSGGHTIRHRPLCGAKLRWSRTFPYKTGWLQAIVTLAGKKLRLTLCKNCKRIEDRQRISGKESRTPTMRASAKPAKRKK